MESGQTLPSAESGQGCCEAASVASFEASTAGACVRSVSHRLIEALAAAGVERAFGVVGGAIAPFCRALSGSSIQYVHCRHETGAAYAAVEASLASGRPTVVFATTGPGLTNAITGMLAARWEGARVVLISAATPSGQRGRQATQETSHHVLPGELFTSNPIFHYGPIIESAEEVAQVAGQLINGLQRREGFIAHVSVPPSVQAAELGGFHSPVLSVSPPCADAATIKRCITRLTRRRFVLWVGHGARGAAAEIRELAERSGASVICTPRAKGVFPEDHPQFVGVSGTLGHPGVEAWLREHRPPQILVLGTRLGEASSGWSPSIDESTELIHVDLDTAAFGRAFPRAPTVGVQAEIQAFVRSLCAGWRRGSRPRPHTQKKTAQVVPLPRTSGPVRPQALMASVQRVVVEASDAVVLAESGNAFVWATHLLCFREPGRFRISQGLGAMGHAACGVIGAALGSGKKAVALLGDGSMLMQNEVSTAVRYGLPAVRVVLNDAAYGMCHQGMRSGGSPSKRPFRRRISRCWPEASGPMESGSRPRPSSTRRCARRWPRAARWWWMFAPTLEVPAPAGGRARSLQNASAHATRSPQ